MSTISPLEELKQEISKAVWSARTAGELVDLQRAFDHGTAEILRHHWLLHLRAMGLIESDESCKTAPRCVGMEKSCNGNP